MYLAAIIGRIAAEVASCINVRHAQPGNKITYQYAHPEGGGTVQYIHGVVHVHGGDQVSNTDNHKVGGQSSPNENVIN